MNFATGSDAAAGLRKQEWQHLQSVCGNFVGQPDAPALLLKVNDDAGRAVLDVPHCQLQLLRAVALQAAQHLCVHSPAGLNPRLPSLTLPHSSTPTVTSPQCTPARRCDPLLDGQGPASRMVKMN